MVNSRSVLLLVCTVLVVGAICGSDARQDGKRRPCCVAVTNLDMSAEVVGETYRQQAATPPCVKAIIFNTEYGPLCADPNAQWVKDRTRHRHPGRIPPCCPAVTKGNKRDDVVGETYREQAATPPCVKAIIFNTKDGQLCADPDAQWVKDLTANMRKV
ncbi:uncharacterized protein LOC109200480 [Oreochromis niloticus]|uniref:uncharacterized protein LOC109200480 n=1 Tax=Oreochromis niloticus TaxID=8128 RepID=UPI000905B486|nr:uncharacterized protein LOC109200480 [Oreochromis niloticus]